MICHLMEIYCSLPFHLVSNYWQHLAMDIRLYGITKPNNQITKFHYIYIVWVKKRKIIKLQWLFLFSHIWKSMCLRQVNYSWIIFTVNLTAAAVAAVSNNTKILIIITSKFSELQNSLRLLNFFQNFEFYYLS